MALMVMIGHGIFLGSHICGYLLICGENQGDMLIKYILTFCPTVKINVLISGQHRPEVTIELLGIYSHENETEISHMNTM